SKGMCPDAFDQFVTQQYRWCTGSMSLLFSKRFHRLDLSVMQRLCFWSGFLYYITTAVNVFVMLIPPIIMGYFAAGQVRMSNYVFVALALIVRQAVVPLITLERESLLGLARIQTTYSFSHAVALWDVVRGPSETACCRVVRLGASAAVGRDRLARTAIRSLALLAVHRNRRAEPLHRLADRARTRPAAVESPAVERADRAGVRRHLDQ